MKLAKDPHRNRATEIAARQAGFGSARTALKAKAVVEMIDALEELGERRAAEALREVLNRQSLAKAARMIGYDN